MCSYNFVDFCTQEIATMKLLIAAAVLAVASCSPQNVFTFTQYNPAGAMPFEEYWNNFKTIHSKYWNTMSNEWGN